MPRAGREREPPFIALRCETRRRKPTRALFHMVYKQAAGVCTREGDTEASSTVMDCLRTLTLTLTLTPLAFSMVIDCLRKVCTR